VTITDPNHELIVRQTTANPDDPMSFTFVVQRPGNHSFCMIAYNPLNVSIQIEKGSKANDLSVIPKKQDVYQVPKFLNMKIDEDVN
jgi:hypothetical protein